MKNEIFTGLLRLLINEVLVEPRGEKYVVRSEDGPNFILKNGGKSPWLHKISDDVVCKSVYRIVKSENDNVDPVDIIKAIKEPTARGNLIVPGGTVDEIVGRAVGYASGWMDMDADIIVTPQSSKTLAIKFAKQIAGKIGAEVIPAATLKNLSTASIVQDLPASFNPKSVKNMHRSLERMKLSKHQDIHSHFRPQDRKFVTNWQNIRSTEAEKFKGSKVIIVDDVVSDGSTMAEMIRVLTRGGANVVDCISMFRTSH